MNLPVVENITWLETEDHEAFIDHFQETNPFLFDYVHLFIEDSLPATDWAQAYKILMMALASVSQTRQLPFIDPLMMGRAAVSVDAGLFAHELQEHNPTLSLAITRYVEGHFSARHHADALAFVWIALVFVDFAIGESRATVAENS